MSGLCDLHCHLVPGVDDGARTLEDAVEMARALVDLGFTTVAPSPHARPEYASHSRQVVEERLAELREALARAGVKLTLGTNAENFLDEAFLRVLGTPEARLLGAGRYVLVELPYTSPVPTLTDILFRIRLKGVTPVLAHPERSLEFERPGRAAEAVRAGALLQLDVGALTGRYGGTARKLARTFLEEGLYALGATDLHGPVGAREWVGKALGELRSRVGERAFIRLMATSPGRLLAGEPLESGVG
ncbi:protein-tyrosine phosphatase [Archangium gephyra]|uniref:protein-tyrosine-phosphatase n=1 Tax=Archangium gephyra TaxID=48 RepID=A0AAC8Q883_9BACT|nr:CpsB/CapC family capsule biosynthesis tyrosine phosphatase [Archangium gephyra]AKJ02875.1 Manganese-dependent protein-tyrosine phosphatase [Archangium gephyra]REG25001.1 protein-tyrosine phosphatase [Archangium gephyra]